MSQYPQSWGILKCRNELDDQYNSKTAFRFSPLQGPANGTNLVFQIPQQRIVTPATIDPASGLPTGGNSSPPEIGPPVIPGPQLYVDDTPLLSGTDYNLTDPLNGIITFTNTGKQPNAGNKFDCTFNWTWLTDQELDSHLGHSANEIGFPLYLTSYDLAIPGASPVPHGSQLPSDIPDALFSAIIMLGAAFAARALSLRFSTKYDTSSGDQSFSPSQMAKSFSELADTLEKQGYTARDDYWKGQSRQYYPAVAQQGFVLPVWTPPR